MNDTESCCACWPTTTIRSPLNGPVSICRLHALLCLLSEGGTGRSLTVARAEKLLASVCIDGPITIERVATGRSTTRRSRRPRRGRVEVRRRHLTAIEASKTTVTEVYGIGPLMAAIIVGRTGDVRRFPSAGHFARHNGTAPIEASSGPTKRHRLNPRGDRQLNHAIHMAAVTQVRHDTPGRAYYLRKQAEGKRAKKHSTHSSAASDASTNASWPTLNADPPTSSSHRTQHPVGSGGQREDVSESGVTGIAPHMTRLFGTGLRRRVADGHGRAGRGGRRSARRSGEAGHVTW